MNTTAALLNTTQKSKWCGPRIWQTLSCWSPGVDHHWFVPWQRRFDGKHQRPGPDDAAQSSDFESKIAMLSRGIGLTGALHRIHT